MIELLFGENDYELTRARKTREDAFDGSVEHRQGNDLSLSDMPDLFSGLTLFSSKRCIVIDRLSENTELWSLLPEWADRLSDDIDILLIEPKPDKRTATYKWLKTNGTMNEYPAFTRRDQRAVEAWLKTEADRRGLSLASSLIRMIVDRAGVDQWELTHVLDKLELSNNVDEAVIRSIVEQRPEESVFALFETALRGDTKHIGELTAELRRTEDAYRVFGLLSSQAIQLYALTLGAKDDRNVAKDFGAAPFALTKLRPYAVRLSRTDLAEVVALFADADTKLKTSQAEPWLVIEQLLLGIAAER